METEEYDISITGKTKEKGTNEILEGILTVTKKLIDAKADTAEEAEGKNRRRRRRGKRRRR